MTATTSQRIAEAALGLILERGLSGVSMSAIADAAGVARQTLYNHYADVDSIVGDVLARHQAEALAQLDLALATADEPRFRIEQIVRHRVAVAAGGHHTIDIRQGLGASVQEVLRGYDEVVRSLIGDALGDARRRGELRSTAEPDRDAAFVHALLPAIDELVAAGHDPAEVAAAAVRHALAIAGWPPPAP